MKTLPFHLARRFVLAGAISSLCLPTHAAPVPVENIREGEVKQQQLQGEASDLAGQLEAMIGEYARNGLGGEDVETVKSLRDSINHLSDGEMQQVVGLLQKAQSLNDAGAAKKEISDAYSAQKTILVQMKRLLAEHQRNQQALELSVELSQLADRQAANLQNGIELGKWAGGRKPENYEAALQAHLEGQQSEQGAIGEELKILAEKIANFAKTAETPELAARFQKGVDAATKLQPSADAAADALKAGQLFKAVSDEKITRDAMRKLAREVAPPQDAAEALRQAERELEKLANEQKELAANAAKTEFAPDFDQWLQAQAAEAAGRNGDKKFRRPIEQLRADKSLQNQFDYLKREKVGELASLDDPQGDLANKTDLAAQDLDKNAPAAAQALKAARDKMQEARAAIGEPNAVAATKNANEAAAALEAAHAQVAQLAGQDAARTPEQTVKNLQALEQAAHELAKREAAAAAAADKSPQAALAQQVQQLAQQAAGQAPQAAAALQQAAADAQQAAAAAAQPGQAAQATAAQQAAAQQLAKADQQLAQEAAQAQQAQRQLAEAQKAAENLKAIIAAQQALERDTAKATAEFKPKKEDLFKGQPDRQEDIQTRTGAFKGSLSPDLLEVLTPLTDATIDMGAAKIQLDKPDGQPADDAENKALADLYRAQKVLEHKEEAADAELGQPEEAQPDANAAEKLAQAAVAANNAMQDLQKGTPAGLKQAEQQLAQAAEQAGEVAAMPELGDAAQQATQEAAQELSQAAAHAGAEHAGPAEAATAQGQQALAHALAALAQAEAGLAQANEPPGPPEAGNHEGPPHPGNHPGNHPGEKPHPGTHAAQNYQPTGEDALQKSTRSAAGKTASFAGLPARERAAIEQAQSEKYPEEYGPLVEQYLRNLAAESSTRK